MADKRVIAVIGATGAQGSGLVRAITSDPDGGFVARAITRDPSSEGAVSLAEVGAEVVPGDLEDPTSIEAAFAGAYGAFCVTFFWADFSPQTELRHARGMAAAAKAAGVEHVVWSTLEDTRDFIPLDDDRMPTLQGKYKVPHFDGKSDADSVFRDAGVPTTYLRTAFYWENFIYLGLEPKRDEDGVLTLTLPLGDKRLPGISSEDIGRCAYGLFKRGPELIGETVSIAGEHPTGAEMARSLSGALGETVRYNEVDPDVYRDFGFSGADELGNMFQFTRDFEAEYAGARDLSTSRSFNPDLLTFDEWLAANASRIPISERPTV
ncbi:MAG: NmrA/HSCARG family protein [Pseudonocardiaceae bacterium]